MAKRSVHLGYEVGTGDAIAVPVFHTCVTGQTQQSGKTTTLEGLITRSGCRAIAFATKRGEGAFADAHTLPPYFVEETGWQFVQSILESTMGQKLGVHRSFIIKASTGARTLADVKRNVDDKLDSARGFAESIYTELSAFLDIVLPQVETLQNASAPPKLAPGLNVMDLTDYSVEMQGLIIRSVIAHIAQHERDTITVIPEAWEFIPQGRSSPVALVAERLIRKGATLGNFIWLDSQDIAGVSKVMIRGAAVWLLGVQREANEIDRVLKSIPAGIAKPSRTDLATLEVGQFYACFGKHVHKVYVQPAWLDGDTARRVALGELDVADVHPPKRSRRVAAPPRPRTKKAAPRKQSSTPTKKPAPSPAPLRKKAPTKPKDSPMPHIDEDLAAKLAKLSTLPEQIDRLTRKLGANGSPSPATADQGGSVDEDALFDRLRDRLLADPDVIQIAESRPVMKIAVARPTIECNGDTVKGRVGLLIAGGFFVDSKTSAAVRSELKRIGPDVNNKSLALALREYHKLGFLTLEGRGYVIVPGAAKRIVEVEG